MQRGQSCRALHVPIGSRLEVITQHEDGTWRVWVSLLNRQDHPSKYRGAYIELRKDGSAWFIGEPGEEYECLPASKDGL